LATIISVIIIVAIPAKQGENKNEGGFGSIPYREKKVTVNPIAHMMSIGSNLSGGFSLDAFNFNQTLFEK
jgi:hypothetical protein